MTGRLILGPVPADFDPARDVVAGPWCFIGREEAHPGWEDLDFVEPFDTPEKLVAAEAEIAVLIDDLAAVWGERLNDRHGLDRPPAFWGRYLTLWLALSAMALWARWRNAEALVARHGERTLDVPVCPEAALARDANFPDFMSRLLSDPAFQFAVDSAILRRRAAPNWTLVETETVPTGSPVLPATEPSPASFARRLMPRLALDHLPGLAASKPLYSAMISLMPRRPAGAPAPTSEADAADFPPAFIALLDRFLEETAPDTIGGAQFPAMDASVAKMRFAPGRLYVANTRSPSDRERLVAAHARMAGERLVNAQHGGWEGTAAAVSWNRHAYAEDHAFLTWGWERQAALPGNCRPFLAPALADLRGRHRETEPALVMVGARMAANGMRFDCVPRPRAMLAYRRDKIRFLGALRGDIAAATRYRAYTRDRADFEDGAYVRRHAPAVRLLDGEFHGAMLGCRLMALDHPGTTMHLAVAADVPMVCFWRPEDWPLCAEAQPWFDALEAAGVLHRDPQAAARKVVAVWEDVAGWWRSDGVASAVAGWRRRYARTGRFARLRLLGTLWRLARAAGGQDRDAMPIPKGRWYASQTNSRVVH